MARACQLAWPWLALVWALAAAALVPTSWAAASVMEDPLGSMADLFTTAKLRMQLSYSPPDLPTTPLSPPVRVLMGPGPSTPHPRVLAAASLPMLGHMHPEFLTIMDETRAWLQYAFQTENPFTIAVSGTGHAAMEAAVATIVEEGDTVLVGINGEWGARMYILAERYGARVVRMDAEPGEVFTYNQTAEALRDNPRTKVLFLVHGESSTGTLQPLDGIGNLCREYGALLFVDAVCTLGGVPLNVDALKIDVIYSGSQKCLGAPVAPSPLSLGPRALEKLAARQKPVQSYYFDMNLVGAYWGVGGQPKRYHHTGMVSNMYALREALAMLAEEGLEPSWERHSEAVQRLWDGLEYLGLEFFVFNPEHRLPTVTTVRVPLGVEWDVVPRIMVQKYGVEIAGGLGPTAGKVWRIGIMGHNARLVNVGLLLHALQGSLKEAGYKPPAERGILW